MIQKFKNEKEDASSAIKGDTEAEIIQTIHQTRTPMGRLLVLGATSQIGVVLATTIVLDLPEGPVPLRAWVDSCADTDFVS